MDDQAQLNEKGYAHAKHLIAEGQYVLDDAEDWSDHLPTTVDENQYIEEHGIAEYSQWFLGDADQQDLASKGRYRFPFGDFKRVHRCAVLMAESQAGQDKYPDIEQAAAHLHGMLDGLRESEDDSSAEDVIVPAEGAVDDMNTMESQLIEAGKGPSLPRRLTYQMHKYLSNAPYPMTQQALYDHALQRGAGRVVLDALERLRHDSYTTYAAVQDELDGK